MVLASRKRYPSDANPNSVQSVVYAPDAFGRPTKVGSYATGIQYHPNGAVASFSYGNGKLHTMSPNLRGLSELSSDSGIVQDRYRYDQNASVLSVTDEYLGASTRTLGYDALDRLTRASAPAMWGAAGYTYNVLDNILTSTVGNRTSSYQCGARQVASGGRLCSR